MTLSPTDLFGANPDLLDVVLRVVQALGILVTCGLSLVTYHRAREVNQQVTTLRVEINGRLERLLRKTEDEALLRGRAEGQAIEGAAQKERERTAENRAPTIPPDGSAPAESVPPPPEPPIRSTDCAAEGV